MPSLSSTTEHVEVTALLGRVRSLQSDIQQALGAAAGSPMDARLADILARLAGAESRLALALDAPGGSQRTADLATLAALVRGIEAIAVSTLQAASVEAAGRQFADMAVTSAATRQTVEALSGDLYQRRIFDPFLQFGSEDDAAEYRAREAARQAAIAAALRLHTPEGDLRAGGLAAGQMLDAHAHGAGASPDFLPAWTRLVEQLHRQRAAMQAAGHGTEAFDRELAADVRRFLQAKGLSEAQIDALMSTGASPLDVVRPYIASDRDTAMLDRMAQRTAHDAPVQLAVVKTDEPVVTPDTAAIDLGAMTARLQAAGVQMRTDAPPPSGHGLGQQDNSAEPVRVPLPPR